MFQQLEAEHPSFKILSPAEFCSFLTPNCSSPPNPKQFLESESPRPQRVNLFLFVCLFSLSHNITQYKNLRVSLHVFLLFTFLIQVQVYSLSQTYIKLSGFPHFQCKPLAQGNRISYLNLERKPLPGVCISHLLHIKLYFPACT